VNDRRIDIVHSQRGTSRVLVKYIDQNPELYGLDSHLLGALKPTRLVVGEVELAQQHRVRRLVERRAKREASPRPTSACQDRAGRHGAFEQVLCRERGTRNA
jgi:hypothetical protein